MNDQPVEKRIFVPASGGKAMTSVDYAEFKRLPKRRTVAGFTVSLGESSPRQLPRKTRSRKCCGGRKLA